jgi:hypothetical protein
MINRPSLLLALGGPSRNGDHISIQVVLERASSFALKKVETRVFMDAAASATDFTGFFWGVIVARLISLFDRK